VAPDNPEAATHAMTERRRQGLRARARIHLHSAVADDADSSLSAAFCARRAKSGRPVGHGRGAAGSSLRKATARGLVRRKISFLHHPA
jgi:hypothetical protein